MDILNDISLDDFHYVIRYIREITGVDLNEFAITSLRRRLTRCMQIHNFRNANALVDKIRENPKFADTFFSDLAVESTEYFRDPGMWSLLREKIIPELLRTKEKINLWFPSCVSGDELYSLLILLHETNFINNTQISVTCLSNRNLEHIHSGLARRDKILSSAENYIQAGGKGKLTNYFTSRGILFYKTIGLGSNMSFDISFLPAEKNVPGKFDMILFRNQLLYFGKNLQNQVLSVFSEKLQKDGILIIGNKEQIDTSIFGAKFQVVDAEENIYRKR